MKKIKFIVVTLSISFVMSCQSSESDDPIIEPPKEPEWVLNFQDDFDDTAVNQSVWAMYNSPGHAGNGLRRPEAFMVEDGNLVVTATMKDGVIVSGMIQPALGIR